MALRHLISGGDGGGGWSLSVSSNTRVGTYYNSQYDLYPVLISVAGRLGDCAYVQIKSKAFSFSIIEGAASRGQGNKVAA